MFVEKAFEEFDISNTGDLNIDESKAFINKMVKTFVNDETIVLSDEQLMKIIKRLDTSGDCRL